ncbi:MAG: hypothetical protein KY468_04125, partial [Armatimonadetes bacterium]|nr:hypothetical protein [Armatimonadota bacterium]
MAWTTMAAPAGALEVVAGTGQAGYGGEGGLAPQALLQKPQAVLEAPDGTVYIADAGNHRIRAVAPS